MYGELTWMAEYVAFAIMLGVSIIIGLYYGCVEAKQNTVNEYLLGGKHMSVFPITMSLIARYKQTDDIVIVFLENIENHVSRGLAYTS